jgi:hypothetical protein
MLSNISYRTLKKDKDKAAKLWVFLICEAKTIIPFTITEIVVHFPIKT